MQPANFFPDMHFSRRFPCYVNTGWTSTPLEISLIVQKEPCRPNNDRVAFLLKNDYIPFLDMQNVPDPLG